MDDRSFVITETLERTNLSEVRQGASTRRSRWAMNSAVLSGHIMGLGKRLTQVGRRLRPLRR